MGFIDFLKGAGGWLVNSVAKPLLGGVSYLKNRVGSMLGPIGHAARATADYFDPLELAMDAADTFGRGSYKPYRPGVEHAAKLNALGGVRSRLDPYANI
jgi:hypothetical protein